MMIFVAIQAEGDVPSLGIIAACWTHHIVAVSADPALLCIGEFAGKVIVAINLWTISFTMLGEVLHGCFHGGKKFLQLGSEGSLGG